MIVQTDLCSSGNGLCGTCLVIASPSGHNRNAVENSDISSKYASFDIRMIMHFPNRVFGRHDFVTWSSRSSAIPRGGKKRYVGTQ